jgi:glycosyltransferase involved in cell wall biosynthesis
MCRGTRPNMNADPNVSVVIATRNRWPLLAANALPSALGQQDVELELIVVDDGSTDETPARLREVDDPRVRVVTNETGLRLPAARNAGAKLARNGSRPWTTTIFGRRTSCGLSLMPRETREACAA